MTVAYLARVIAVSGGAGEKKVPFPVCRILPPALRLWEGPGGRLQRGSENTRNGCPVLGSPGRRHLPPPAPGREGPERPLWNLPTQGRSALLC